MELKTIYDLWDRFESSSTVELELDLNGAHLHLRKSEGSSPAASSGTDLPAKIAPGTGQLAKMTEKMGENAGGTVPTANYEVKAPLAGTFYRQPSPEAKPFVEVGAKVHKGDIIGIIEAMKLMNEVTATVDGIVAEIPAENGSLVEYNQVLIRLQEK